MAASLYQIFSCICPSDIADDETISEKRALLFSDARTTEQVADEVVQAILSTDRGGAIHRDELDDIVGAYGWTEKLAEWILNKLEQALKEGSKLKPFFKNALDKVWQAVQETEGFVRDHPVMCTVIALGVLVIIAPWVLETLGFCAGFGELGPIEGSFAARWQAMYGAQVPRGSLFAFFQRLGMTWR